MNFLDSYTRRPLSKAPEHKKEQRIFGKDITNIVQDKPKVNQSFQQKPTNNQEKVETRTRSKSIVPVEPPKQKDVVYQYEAEIINTMLTDNNMIKPIKCSSITLKMRAILIDWLVDVHGQFQLKEETLFFAIRILDDYCAAAEEINKKQLQLVGITCLWIASKYEEIYPPKMKNYVVVTDNTYTQTQIHETESKILETLKFRIVKTTTLQFLATILGCEPDSTCESFCRYLLEIANIQFATSEYKPTVLVLTVIEMCQRLLKQKVQIKKFKELFKVDQDEINKCFKHLCKLLNGSSWDELNAVKRKYSKPKFNSVGRIKLEKAGA